MEALISKLFHVAFSYLILFSKFDNKCIHFITHMEICKVTKIQDLKILLKSIKVAKRKHKIAIVDYFPVLGCRYNDYDSEIAGCKKG